MEPLEPRHPAPFPVVMSWLDAWRPTDLPEGGAVLVMLSPQPEHDVSKIEMSLSPEEKTRRDGIQHPRAFAEFHAGRRLIREVLGGLLEIGPAKVRLLESERGALSLDPAHGSNLRFNLSHTDGLVVLAVATDDIGVDVEWLDRRGRTLELADRYFAPTEIDALRALPADLQRDRFFDLWTLKESYIKARGLGLAMPLAKFAFSGFGATLVATAHEADTARLTVTVDPAHADRPDSAWSFGVWQTGRHRVALARSG